jgi:hypothetical protein
MRKGKQFWTIRLDRRGRYDMIPAFFQQRDGTFKGGAVFYRIAFECDGRQETIVVDIESSNIFAIGCSSCRRGIESAR